MLVLKSKKDLHSKASLIPKEIIPRIEEDLKIIEEEYPHYDDEFISSYGPVVILLDRSERAALKKKMPIIKSLTTEYEEIVFDKSDTKIKKKLYILTESGILLYERSQKWGND